MARIAVRAAGAFPEGGDSACRSGLSRRAALPPARMHRPRRRTSKDRRCRCGCASAPAVRDRSFPSAPRKRASIGASRAGVDPGKLGGQIRAAVDRVDQPLEEIEPVNRPQSRSRKAMNCSRLCPLTAHRRPQGGAPAPPAAGAAPAPAGATAARTAGPPAARALRRARRRRYYLRVDRVNCKSIGLGLGKAHRTPVDRNQAAIGIARHPPRKGGLDLRRDLPGRR